jgi:hypothetical protein
MAMRSTSLTQDSVVAIGREIGSQYDNVKVVGDSIADVTTVAESIGAVGIVATSVGAVVALVNIDAAITSLYTDKATLDSLYADKVVLDSLYTDKVTLDSLYEDKATLDSLYADKAILDSIFADKTTLDSLYADKAVLDSIYADKAKLDSIFADKTTLDRIYTSIGNIDRVHSSIDNVDIVGASIANVDVTAPNIGSVNTVAAGIVNVSTVATNIVDVSTVAGDTLQINEIYNNRAEIYQADDNAVTATAKAGEAFDSANYAEEWANKAENVLVSAAAGGDQIGDYSAMHWAQKTAADRAQTTLDRAATAADLVETNQDTMDTAADRVQTGLDRVATGNDVDTTNADVVTTNADRVITNADAVQTGLDRVATGNDVAATAQDVLDTAADLVLTNADVVLTHADVVNTNADVVTTGNNVTEAQAAQGLAEDARDAAAISEINAEAAWDSLDDRYLGMKVVEPTADNDGDALVEGALYWNSTDKQLYVWDSLSWVDAAFSINEVVTSFNTRQGDVILTDADVDAAVGLDVNAAITANTVHSTSTGADHTYIDQDVTSTGTPSFNSVQLNGGSGSQGLVTWNADEETLDLQQNNTTLQMGQEIQAHVRNGSGSTIVNGTVVMVTGTLGASGKILVQPYDGVSLPKYILGIATESIADGEDGKITTFGKIRGLDTSAWSEGDELFVTTNGGLVNTEPTTGVKVAIAYVINVHASNGTIMARFTPYDENLAYTKAESDGLLDDKQDILAEGAFVDGDKTKLNGIESGAKGDQAANEVPVTANGNLSSTNVQSALEELQEEINTINEGEW